MKRLIHNPQSLGNRIGFKFYTPIAMLFISLSIIINIITQKVIPVFGDFVLTAGDFVYPLMYMISIVLTEVYGYALSRRIIWGGWVCNIIAACIMWGAIVLPAAKCWHYQTQFKIILGRAPQILLASFIAFIVGEFISIYVLAKLKVFTVGKFIWLRTFMAIITGGVVDTILFGILAFGYTLAWHDIFMLNITSYLFKVVYQILLIPGICIGAQFLKNREGIDIFDKHTNFNPFKLKV
jgi:queuosine precursor transporter